MLSPCGRSLRRLAAATLAMAAMTAASAGDERDGAGEEDRQGGGLQITHQATISAEAALDTNARRQQAGAAVEADALAYLYATGRIDGRRPGRQLTALYDLGAKRFARTSAEDMVVGRLRLRWVAAPRPWVVLSTEASYKDRFQRGDPVEEVENDPYLSCRPPEGPAGESYRCNRRDYRQGSLAGSLDLRRGGWSLSGRAGASSLDYKPNRQFSYGGPDGSLAASRSLGRRHGLRAQMSASLRFYHPESVTYRVVPSAEGVVVQEVSESRVEQVLSGGLSWRYRGPVLLSTNAALVSSRNNSDGMDVLRARAELAVALRLGSSTTLVGSAAFQLAHYPEGNVFRLIAMRADEDERQNSLSFQVTHRLTESLALVLKGSAFSNEFSGDTVPFRRQAVHGGVRWSL